MSDIQTINKTIQIDAEAKKIWEVLTSIEHYADWAGVFSPGIFAKTDWREGSEVIFSDDSKGGLIGHIITNKYPTFLEMGFDGEIVEGIPVYDSENALTIKGTKESYKLSEEYEFTTLEIRWDMTMENYDEMNQKWDEALLKIKELAEM